MYINTKSKLAAQALFLTTMLLGCGDNKTSNEYIAEARAAFNKGENSVAIISLKNVLKTEKNNLEARFLLGSVYAQQGLWVNAEKELRIASNAGFTDGNIDMLLTKIHYRLEDNDYLTSVKNIQNEYSDLPKIYLAILAIKQGDVAEGRSIFDEITLAGSNQDLSNLAMAWDSFLNADYAASLKLLDTLVVASVIKEDVIELRVVNLVAQKKHEAAAEQLEIFLALHPQSHIHRLQLAEQYVKYRNYEKAEKNADLLLSYYKHNVILNRIKAEIKFNTKEYKLAKEFAEISLRNSNNVLSKVIAGMSAYQLGQYEAAYNYLNAVSTDFAEAHPVNQILIALSNQLSFSTGANNELLSDTVLSLINSGDYQQTRDVLIKASDASRLNDGVINFQLGLLKIIEGDSTFTDDFERAISNGFNDIAPKVLLAELYLREKEYIKVLEIADSLSSSNKVAATLLKGSVYLEKGEFDKAILAYKGILSSEPEHMGAMFKLSETYFKDGNTTKSIELLKNIYKISASNVYAVRSLFKFSLEPSNKKMLEEFFISQVKVDKKNINRHVVLTEFYLLHNEAEQALSIASRYLLKNPEQLEMTLLKTRALLSLNRINDVKDILVILNNIAPTHPSVIKSKAYILNFDGNKTEAIKVIEDFRSTNNGLLNDDLLLLISIIYVENINILKAEESLKKVKNKQHPRYSRIAGKMALIKGDSPLAVELLSKAYKSSPSQLVALELAQALQNEGEFDEAIQLLENFLLKNNGIKLSLVNYKLAELCEEKYPEKAERLYKQLLIETNESVATLNNIAWFYYTQQRYVEGKMYANLAVTKAPELAAVHNTLGVILLELGDLPKANQHLQTSVNIEPHNDKYKIWLAKSFILNGKHESASKIRRSINFEVLKAEVKILFNDVYKKG
jgi:putative PEP-CTERM system TPR-repeat lipoprotein